MKHSILMRMRSWSIKTVVFFVLVLVVTQKYQLVFPAFAQTESSTDSATTGKLPQSAINLTMSPVTLNLETKPGEPITVPFKIKNNNPETESLILNFGTFKADESGQKPQLLDPKPNDTFMNWLTTDTNQFDLPSNEWKTVNVTFSPPPDAALTYYYTIIISRGETPKQPGETVITGSPALLVLATVTSPNAKKELQLNSFIAKNPVVEKLPQTFDFAVQNTGNVHITPTGNIFIDGEGKQDLVVLPVNAGNNTVLPGTTRTYSVVWEDPPSPERNNGPFDWDFGQGDHLRWGKYTAHILLVYDNGERDIPIESFVSFWLFPWKIMLLRIAVPIVPAILVYLIMRWQLARQAKKRDQV